VEFLPAASKAGVMKGFSNVPCLPEAGGQDCNFPTSAMFFWQIISFFSKKENRISKRLT